MEYLKITAIAIMILGLWPPGLLGAEPSAEHIEIFVAGKKYGSVEGYREDKDSQAVKDAQTGDVSDDSVQDMRRMFSEAAHAAKNPLSLKFDPARMKTVYIKKPVATVVLSAGPQDIKDPFTQSYTRLSQVGFDRGVHRVISDFMLSAKNNPMQVVKTDELEGVLRHSFGGSNAPLLLISDHNTLRIMALDNGKETAKTGKTQ
jgi:hypothetical protein